MKALMAPMSAEAMAMDEAKELMERVTVRKRFETVPYYAPSIAVDESGRAKVTISMPDNLTNFLVRAKAVSGAERHGFAKGKIEVRMPLIVQPALPRFARPGDLFTASAIGRVVEGEGGKGLAAFKAEGVTLEGESAKEVNWIPGQVERFDFPVTVGQPEIGEDGKPALEELIFKVAVKRDVDGASDAFEVKIPLIPDRRPLRERVIAELGASGTLKLPSVEGGARPGSVSRRVLVSARGDLLKMAAGLNFLMQYPFGCTEQRLSRARAHLALTRFRDLLKISEGDEGVRNIVEDALAWIPGVVNDEGLAGLWPGSTGYVWATAYVYEFLVEAQNAGFHVDSELKGKLANALNRALRSDYSRFIDGASWFERTSALRALALGGDFSRSYGAELLRKAQFLDLESSAKVYYAFNRGGKIQSGLEPLATRMTEGVMTRLHQGREIYGGLQDGYLVPAPLVISSETRVLSEVVRAMVTVGDTERLEVLVDGLVTLGKGDGWGSTNANAAALLALSEVLTPPFKGGEDSTLKITGVGEGATLATDAVAPLAENRDNKGAAATLERLTGERPLGVWAELTWTPEEDGSKEVSASKGFAVSREQLKVLGPGLSPVKVQLDKPALELGYGVGDVVEDHVEVVNPTDRYFVAVVVPLAAGMEPLNPNLATAPPEAAPDGKLTIAASYAAYLDDHVAFYYDRLPKGTYHFYFRTRAATQGSFIQPGAYAELMYDGAVRGNSNGARLSVKRAEK
jgi:uncharacterized protein YfaS (alpha-2-macroglobulin family)